VEDQTRGSDVLDHSRLQIVTALVAKYRDRVSEASIVEVVDSTWDDVASRARFSTYLPVIVRRAAEDRLRAHKETEPAV
jgi:Protein-tyrosine-phosphatase-like, N-terminal domain